jgi:hypothetical protein
MWIFLKRCLHDMLNISTFIANVALIIGGSIVHSLIGLSIDWNVKYQNLF